MSQTSAELAVVASESGLKSKIWQFLKLKLDKLFSPWLVQFLNIKIPVCPRIPTTVAVPLQTAPA